MQEVCREKLMYAYWCHARKWIYVCILAFQSSVINASTAYIKYKSQNKHVFIV